MTMIWDYDFSNGAYEVDVFTYDQLPHYAQTVIDRFLRNNKFDPRTVYHIEIRPGAATVQFYELDEDGKLFRDEEGRVAHSRRSVYDGRIQKAVYYDLRGRKHESFVYRIA